MITLDQFKQIAPQCKNQELWYNTIVDILPTYTIDSNLRIAAFMAEMVYESNQFNEISENLNYSAEGLIKTFPIHFNSVEATEYQHQPEKIANRVYGCRNGNGDETSGDGYKYRGRGLVQLTFHDNYSACSQSLNGDNLFLDDPDQLLRPDVAVSAACWYWNNHNLNALADAGDLLGITKKINGGINGQNERESLYQKILGIINE